MHFPLNECWQSYRADIVPIDASPDQVQECRRAFYAGAAAILGLVAGLGRPAIPVIVALETLEDLDAELEAFGKAVKNGRA